VVFIHRAVQGEPTLADEWKLLREVLVAKVRDGEPGYFD
jgi:hypothetical protein